ncbi:unnamed protein product [Adineta ricciae]|uniref:G-protein coupled receptors family 1 profile domain-containing protein n=1 Tax=Adineta ricciae TaxID=249248 RepID=A0A815I278_ADIRI|nr:unnamed protein product [Adineta ricciae]CAF1360218.1 unnamed protein product [Adineta ricciae]
MATNDSDFGEAFDTLEISLPRSVRFWLLLLVDTPSIICSFILLFYLFGNRTARQALNNHAIVVIILFGLGTELIDVPLYLTFIVNSGWVTPATPAICLIWWFVAFGLYNGGQVLMAWAAIERHILIFHDRWLGTKRSRFIAHYLPLILVLVYVFVFYVYVLFIFPCENVYVYDLPVCDAYPCYQEDSFLGIWDFLGNNILPGFLVAVVSMALLARVIRQKQRLNQAVQWRKIRRMTIQLLSISILNVIFILPLNLLALAHMCGLPEDYGAQIQQYLYFAGYLFIFLIPFVSLASLPDLCKEIQMKIQCRRQSQGRASTNNARTISTARR